MNLWGKVRIIMLKGEKGEQGEAGVSGDYAGLTNKPSINNHELNGNSSSADLGMVSQGDLDALESAINGIGTRLVDVEDQTDALTEALTSPSWDKLAEVSGVTNGVNGSIYYKTLGDTVTLKFNLDLYGSVSAGDHQDLVASLPAEITPLAISAGGLGGTMCSPAFPYIFANTLLSDKVALIISSGKLSIYFLDSYTVAGTHPYVHSEWEYNTKI